MNYGALRCEDVVKSKECLWVNTLPNDTILLQYNEEKEVSEIVDKLKKLDISFSRSKPYNFIPNSILGKDSYTELKSLGCQDFEYSNEDYSPVAYMFTNRGEYGYSQLTVYMNDGDTGLRGGTVLAYEHQYKGSILIHYYLKK